jgi:hypothetical protein
MTTGNVAASAQVQAKNAEADFSACYPTVVRPRPSHWISDAATAACVTVFAAAGTPGHPSAAASAAPDTVRTLQMRTAGWDVELAPRGEPGRRLLLEGTARDSAGGAPLSGLHFYLYQADARGLYGPPGPDMEKPRLAGFVRTGPLGQFRIRTILPGTYGGPPHLHFEFRDSLGGMRMTFLNLFPPHEGDYAVYGPHFTPKSWRSRAGLKRFSFSTPGGPLNVVQPADLEIFPDSAGVFRATWELVVSHSAPVPEHPGWGPEAPH